MKEKAAAAISFVFDPSVTFPLLLIVLISKTNLSSDQIRLTLPLILLTDIVLPGIVWFFSLKRQWVSDWEITKRAQRPNVYLTFSFFFFLGTGASFLFGNKLLGILHLIFTVAFFLATLITLFWKISIHMVVDTTVVTILNFLFPSFWFFYLLLPIIAWSRFVRHKHTPGQLLSGFLLGLAVVFSGLPFWVRLTNMHAIGR